VTVDDKIVGRLEALHPVRRPKRGAPAVLVSGPAEHSEPVYEAFCASLRGLGATVEQGVFGAAMSVDLSNDGSMTIMLELC